MADLTVWNDCEIAAVVIHDTHGKPGDPCLIIEPENVGKLLEALSKAAYSDDCDPHECCGRFNVLRDE